jgi:hypothetical protein
MAVIRFMIQAPGERECGKTKLFVRGFVNISYLANNFVTNLFNHIYLNQVPRHSGRLALSIMDTAPRQSAH